MRKVGTVTIGGEQISVEYELENISEEIGGSLPVPEQGTPAGFAEAVRKAADITADTGAALKRMITALAQTASDALHATDADEWSVELNVGFGGKISPIPTIVSGEATAAIKVQAKWTRKPP